MHILIGWIDRLMLFLAGALTVGFLGCVTLQVFFRYVLEDSLVWSEELARYLFVWSSLLAAAVAVGRNDHFNIPLFADMLGPPARRLLDILVTLLCLVFAAIMLRYGFTWSRRLMAADSPVLQIPQGLVYMIVPIVGLAMLARWSLRLLELIRGPAADGIR